MPSRSPRRSARARARLPTAAEPPPGLFPAREDLVRLLAVISIAAAAAAACSVLNRRPQPFCDSPQSPDDYADADWCQPCPPNGRCVDGEMECVQGFKRHGKACIEDGLLSQTANRISQLLQLRICDQHARALCGQPAQILGAGECWGLLQHSIYFQHAAPVMMEPKLAALLWILWIIYWRRVLSNRAEQIYEQVCEILEDNAVNAKIDNSSCEPWVVTSWLRDHLLVPRERKDAFLWKKVEELILEDSRIDQYPKVIKGESKVVYEWQASGSLSAKNKKVQGARVNSRTGGGAKKLAEEMGACLGE